MYAGEHMRYISDQMPGRPVTPGANAVAYSSPVVEDYGDLVELTSSHHVAAFQGIQGAIGLMSFSPGPNPPPRPNPPPAPPHGPGHASGGLSGAGGISQGTGGTVSSSTPSGGGKGRLPFTGLTLWIEGLVSLAAISAGLVLRRFTRRGDDAPDGPAATG